MMTVELKKSHLSRLVGEAETQNGLVPHPHVVDKDSRGVSWEQGVPDPYHAPQPRVPVPGRLVPITSGCKNQQGLCQLKKLMESQAVPLKEATHGLTQTYYL